MGAFTPEPSERRAKPRVVLLGRAVCLLALLAPALALALGNGAFEESADASPRGFTEPLRPSGLLQREVFRPRPDKAVGSETAVMRHLNASIPLAKGKLAAVQPFMISSAFKDRERAVDCLAAAQYYEAGRGGVDQRAVAQVVLNRVRHAAFPNTVCGVIFQGSHLSTGCQFTFTCDGSMNRRLPSREDWRLARLTAEQMLNGRTEALVGQATHYHTDWVSPVWNRQMDKIAVAGPHLFFSWRGSRGEARALNQVYGGHEPNIPQLQRLSAAHRETASADGPTSLEARPPDGPENLSRLQTAGSGAAQPIAGREVLPDRLTDGGRGVHLVVLPAGIPSDGFLAIAQEACAGQPNCRFIGWVDPARQAHGLPMSGSSVDAVSFMYSRRDLASAGLPQWDCRKFPRPDTTECLKR